MTELNNKLMTTTELAEFFKTSPKVILENAKKYLPSKVIENGKTTYWTEAEITILLEELKKNQANQSTFTGAVKVMKTSLTNALKIKQAMEIIQEAYEDELHRLQIANDEQQAIIEQQKPKVLFANSVASSKNSMLVGELAKIITQNGYPIGQNRLFSWLRDNGYLAKYGERKNLPNQQYIEQGLFEIKKTTIDNPDGTIRTTSTTKVTGKGAIYFVNKFLNNQNNNYLKVGNDN